MEEKFDPKEFLLFGLKHYGIKVREDKAHLLILEHEYSIEIEGPELFKLAHEGQIVGPFGSVEELCEFLHMDIQLNYG